MATASFKTGYLDRAIDNLAGIIDEARVDLAGVDYDTLVGTGFSGGIVIPSLALALGKKFVLIRKENDDSHHGGGRLIGNLGHRWIFVDDFVSSGDTKQRCLKKVAAAASVEDFTTTYVGDYLYIHLDRERFVPAVDANPGYRYPMNTTTQEG